MVEEEEKEEGMKLFEIISLAIISYLIGSISFAYLIGKKLKGIDVKDYGNAGAATVYREVSRPAGALVLILDVTKAIIPTYIVLKMLGLDYKIVVLIASLTVVGHNWPIYYRFRGGAGLSCSIGVLLCLLPRELFIILPIGALAAGIFWKIFAFAKFKSTVPGGAMVGMTILPFLTKFTFNEPPALFALTFILPALAAIKKFPLFKVKVLPLFKRRSAELR